MSMDKSADQRRRKVLEREQGWARVFIAASRSSGRGVPGRHKKCEDTDVRRESHRSRIIDRQLRYKSSSTSRVVERGQEQCKNKRKRRETSNAAGAAVGFKIEGWDIID